LRVADILDYYANVNQTTALDRDKLSRVYLPIETCLFEEHLQSS